MKHELTCCGFICKNCKSYKIDCEGCRETQGKVGWLEEAGLDICPIYNCCIIKKKLEYCIECKECFCSKFTEFSNSSLSFEELEEMLKEQKLLMKEKINE
ncbi:MAG: DUF3795 domain-containing protein [Sphaerochaetaceae bacterium]|nr:DUF3795 domain-containing protein [Sphaerochaetaceae bacterium]